MKLKKKRCEIIEHVGEAGNDDDGINGLRREETTQFAKL